MVTTIKAGRVEHVKYFYGDILDMNLAMDHGWIVTYVSDSRMMPQASIAYERGSGTPVPDISMRLTTLTRLTVVYLQPTIPSNMAL